MTVLPVRELLKFQSHELLIGLKTSLNILWEDNITTTMTHREIIVQRYILELMVIIPELPIISRYNITNYYTNGIYTSKTINNYYEATLKDIVEFYCKPNDNRDILPLVYASMQSIYNNIYNDVIYNITDYSSSISITDFLDIQFKPELITSMKNVAINKDVDSVNKTYDVLDNIMRNDISLKDNVIVRGYISGTVSPNQVKQLLASRGYVTEIDSNIFKYPISSSFTLGMTDLYDVSVESRSGAKALYMSNKAVPESEYFARELQLVTMVVEKLVDGDCGNRDYMDWYIRPKEKFGKSDLSNIVGKRYLDTDGVEKVITLNCKHLEDTTIKLRVAFRCKLPNKTHICTSCFGELSYGVHIHSNIGHFSATEVTQKVTQSILSTKHLTSSATVGDIKLDETAKKFFNVKNKNNYAFKANLINKSKTKYSMIVNQYDAFGLKDLNKSVDVYKLNPQRISRIESIILVTETGDNTEYHPIIIKDASKYGSFTYEFLEYIVNVGNKLDSLDRYVIDLSGWTTAANVIAMPELEYNYLALAKNIKHMFKYMAMEKTGTAKETPESLLQKLFDVINSKLDVNLAMLEVIVYAFTIMSKENSNYDLGRNTATQQLMPISRVVTNRSLGAGYAWEKVVKTIISPRSFAGFNNISHPLDVLIRPAEVIRDYYGKNKDML